MNGRSLAALVVLAGAGGWSLVWLLETSAASGAFPEYSSLRADPSGTKLLYASLARMPGVKVERSFVPWKLFHGSDAAVLYLGVSSGQLRWMPQISLKELEQAASNGNRIILGLFASRPLARSGLEVDPPIERRWGLRVNVPAKRPLSIHLSHGKEWREIEGDSIIERPFGKGSVLLVGDATLFTNGAQSRRPEGYLLAKLLGGRSHIIFEESHLGVIEGGSIMKLARRYRLHGFLAGFLVWVALYVWRNASSFPPRYSTAEPAMVSGRTSLSGLETLLRRNIRQPDVARVAFSAWRKTAERSYRREEIDRAARVLESASGPAAAVLERVRAELPRRGKGAE